MHAERRPQGAAIRTTQKPTTNRRIIDRALRTARIDLLPRVEQERVRQLCLAAVGAESNLGVIHRTAEDLAKREVEAWLQEHRNAQAAVEQPVSPEQDGPAHISARDATQLTYGAGTAPVYHDPNAAVRARRMLLWIPTAPSFSDCLNDFEGQVWSLSFDGQHTQTEIAEIVHRRQGSISKIQDRCVRKLNERYRALLSQDQLPIAILAWIKDSGANADTHDNSFMNVVHLLRLRDRALRRGDVEKATTGCNDLDGFQIKNY